MFSLRFGLGCTFMVGLVLAREAFAQTPAPVSSQAPNIVFIMADDLGYGDVGCYGQTRIPTPNLDRLAREGLRFTQFYAGSSVCAPSRNALMTGEHTGHAQIRGNAKLNLRPTDTTVAQVLKSVGYQTGLIGKWGLGTEGSEATPNKKGFDYFFGYIDQTHAHNSYPTFLIRNGTRVPLHNVVPAEGRYGQGVASQRADYSDDLFITDALDFIDRQQTKRFFLYFAPTLPHANNEAGSNGLEIPDLGVFAKENWSENQKRYAAMVSRLDSDVGRILEKIETLGLAEKTLFFFTSDNGPHQEGGNDPTFFQSSGQLRGIKRDLYEGGIRVPMIARWPNHISKGTISDHVAYLGDFIATATELSGATIPTKIDSVSLVPTLQGNKNAQQEHEFLYWEFYEGESSQAVRMGNWKAVRMPMLTGPIALFDLTNDIGEKHDIAAAHPDVVQHISRIMEHEHVPSPLWPTPLPSEKFFKGGALTGWEFINPENAPLSASVSANADGSLSITGKPIGYLQTAATYSDFQLHAEWRWTGTPGNSGVLVHISTGPVDRNLWPTCFQIQTKYSRAGDLLPMADAKFAESLSSPADAKTKVLNFIASDSEKPVGEWNSCDVTCRGNTIEVLVNGVLQNRVTHCTPSAGHVGFQFEGAPYQLRNAWIRPLR